MGGSSRRPTPSRRRRSPPATADNRACSPWPAGRQAPFCVLGSPLVREGFTSQPRRGALVSSSGARPLHRRGRARVGAARSRCRGPAALLPEAKHQPRPSDPVLAYFRADDRDQAAPHTHRAPRAEHGSNGQGLPRRADAISKAGVRRPDTGRVVRHERERQSRQDRALAIAWKHAPNPALPAPRSPPRAALSLARERFAEKRASGSRPCPVVRRSCLRPNPSVRPGALRTTAFIFSAVDGSLSGCHASSRPAGRGGLLVRPG